MRESRFVCLSLATIIYFQAVISPSHAKTPPKRIVILAGKKVAVPSETGFTIMAGRLD